MIINNSKRTCVSKTTLLTVLELDGDGGIFLNLLLYLNHGEVCRVLKLCRAIVQREKALSNSQLNHLWGSIAKFNAPSSRVVETLNIQMKRLIASEDGQFNHIPGQLGNEENAISVSPQANGSRIVSQRVYAMNNLQHLRWDRITYESEACPRMDKMEGHAIAHVSNGDGDWAVVINGWGSNSSNEAYVINGATLDVESKTIRTIPTTTVNNPRFRYGFSAICTADSNRLIVYGGCSMGGYSGECADLYFITLDFHRNEALEVIAVTATYSPRISFGPGSNPMTRGYHTANSVFLNGEEHMLVFGGLHRRAPTSTIDVYNISKNIWSTEVVFGVSGSPPSPRFGHSSVFHPPSDSFIITGGSDGNDLWRNGRELTDVYVLSVIRSNSERGDLSDSLVWSRPNLWGPSLQQMPGRCHCANLVGSKIVFFSGGGRYQSNEIVVLDLLPSEEKLQDMRLLQGQGVNCEIMVLVRGVSTTTPATSSTSSATERNFYLYKPTMYFNQRTPHTPPPSPGITTSDGETFHRTHFPSPLARCSAVSVQFGRCLFYFGGWNQGRNELNDLWSLDLTYSSSEEYAVSRSLGERGSADVSGLKRDHADVDDDDDDDEDHDDNHYEDNDDDDDDADGSGNTNNLTNYINAFLAAQGYTSTALASFLTGGMQGYMDDDDSEYHTNPSDHEEEDVADNAMEEMVDEYEEEEVEEEDDEYESHGDGDVGGTRDALAVEDIPDGDENEDENEK